MELEEEDCAGGTTSTVKVSTSFLYRRSWLLGSVPPGYEPDWASVYHAWEGGHTGTGKCVPGWRGSFRAWIKIVLTMTHRKDARPRNIEYLSRDRHMQITVQRETA